MTKQLRENISEFSYLTATKNTDRYRCIMRLFYEQYQKMNYWLQPEEIVKGVLSFEGMEEYDLDMCQADLLMLVNWKNLTEQHDSTRVTTIEDYLKKRYRYMMTPYSIEIERLVSQLETIKGYGGSLQPSKLHELVQLVQRVYDWPGGQQDHQAEELWDKLMGIFKDLNEQASDYIASLNSKQAEDLVSTEAFLVYKDQVIGYLQDFIQVLQQTAPEIAHWLRKMQTAPAATERFLQQVTQAKSAVPFMEETVSAEEWQGRVESQWGNLLRWFVGDEMDDGNADRLEQMAKETVFKLVRAALRIQEQGRHGNSRRQELDAIGWWFLRLVDDFEEAHRLAASVFGLYETRHFFGEHDDRTHLADTSMWETMPYELLLTPRGHQSRQRQNATPPAISRTNKTSSIEEYLRKKQQEEQVLQRFLERGTVMISDIEDITVAERQQLLMWIGRCLNHRNLRWKTPDGVTIQLLYVPRNERTVLHGEDGDLEMPNFTLAFRKGEVDE